MLKGLPLGHKERLLRNPRMLSINEVIPFLRREPTLLRITRGTWRDGESGRLHKCLNLTAALSLASDTRGALAGVEQLAEEPDTQNCGSSPDYVITVHAALERGRQLCVGRASVIGRYRIRTRTQRDSGTRHIMLPSKHSSDEAIFLTLCADLDDLLARILRCGSDPSTFTVAVHSSDALFIRQLKDINHACAAKRMPLRRQTQERLARFGQACLQWAHTGEILGQLRS
jgi:hypothetical protein